MLTDGNPLTIDEIKKLNRTKNKHLDESGDTLYTIRFMFNTEWNEATDPKPFRIKPSLAGKLADSSHGMPYVIAPYGEKYHIKGNEPTVSSLMEKQMKYSIGVIDDHIKTEKDNYFAIISVWPEFWGAVQNELIPPYTSPTLDIIDEDESGINDADFLNLHGVPKPGYVESLSGIKSVCKNGLQQCMTEIKQYGASGHLQKFRNSKSFSNSLSNNIQSMSAQESTPAMSTTDIEKAVKPIMDELKVIEAKVEKVEKMEEAIIEVVQEVAVQADGVDDVKIKKDLEQVKKGEAMDVKKDESMEITTPPMGADPKIAGASGVTLHNAKQIMELTKKLEESNKKVNLMEKKQLDDAKSAAEKLRLEQATSIVESKLKLQEIKVESKDEEIKNYVELKNDAGDLIDLSLTAKELTAKSANIAGASGARYFEVPELSTNNDNSKFTNSQAMEMI